MRAAKLPADAGTLTILRSDQISTAQDIAKLIRTLPVVLTLLVIVLYALAIWLAGPRRREALRSVGIGFVVAGAVAVTVIVVVAVAVVVGVFHGVAAARVASVAMETRAGARNIILLVSAAVTGEGAAGCSGVGGS